MVCCTMSSGVRMVALLVLLTRNDVQADRCGRNETNYLKMCMDGTFEGTELFVDTDLFLNTDNPFCICEINVTETLSLIPAASNNSNCGPLLSVKTSPDVTLKQFTCKLTDPLNLTMRSDPTFYLELKGVGNLRTCIQLVSENNFNLACYTAGNVPRALTTIPPTTQTSTSTTMSLSSSTSSAASAASAASNNGSTTAGVTSPTVTDWRSTAPMPLTSGIEESFVLILTACVLGFLTLVAVVVLIICKYVRHVRNNREREDHSYDITMRPTVQKLSARKLDDNDVESMTVDNPVYERTRNGRIATSKYETQNNLNSAAAAAADTADGQDGVGQSKDSEGLIYADLDHSESKPNGKLPSNSDKVEYSVVLRKK